MKAEKRLVAAPKVFVPVELKITFETKEELGAFYALFNFSPICDLLDKAGFSARPVRTALEVDYNGYKDFHAILCDWK